MNDNSHEQPQRFLPTGKLLAGLAFALMVTVVISSSMGFISIPFTDIIKIILAQLAPGMNSFKGIDPFFTAIIIDVRLPRVLCSAIVGGGLAISGTVFQGILLNPLADPYTLGVSTGAAFGASLALIFDLSFIPFTSVPLFAFLGAIATLFAVIILSSNGWQFSSHYLILSGIIVASILSAGISFLKYLADEEVSAIVFWLMGSFASKTWQDVILTLIISLSGGIYLLFYAKDLNILSLGEKNAAILGVDPRRTSILLISIATVITASCVSVSGIIGFVGLLVPHIMRPLAGSDHMRLLPVSFLSGSILLLSADTLARSAFPVEMPVGVITALIGGPFFCYVLKKHHAHRSGEKQ